MSNKVIYKTNVLGLLKSLGNDKEQADSKLCFSLSFVKNVNEEINLISNNFFRIGFLLCEAVNYEYYKELGFDNIVDCAEYYFGFKKTTTYDLMKIYKVFCDDKKTWYMPEKWRGFSQSQLSEMASVNFYSLAFVSSISKYDSISDIKEAKKYWNLIKQGKLDCKLITNYSRGYISAKEIISKCKSALSSVEKTDVVIPVNEVKEINENSERSENSLPDVVIEKNSGCPENGILYIDDDDPFFDKIKECFSDFLIDNCVFPSRDQFLHEFTCDFLVVLRNFINANMSNFIKYLKSDSFVEQYKNFHPELIFRDKE